MPDKLAPRRFQFRLRTLMIFVTVLAVWLGQWSRAARLQRDALTALRRCGATVYYDFELQSVARRSRWQAWLADVVGIDYVAKVHEVSFINDADDANLVSLQNLSELQRLELDSSRVADAGLSHLPSLMHLQFISLECDQVTDAGLAHLRGLPDLRCWLTLSETKVSGTGVARLKKSLPNCKIIY